MTHRGPFQPLPFCDSVILCHSRMQDTLTGGYTHHKNHFPSEETVSVPAVQGCNFQKILSDGSLTSFSKPDYLTAFNLISICRCR